MDDYWKLLPIYQPSISNPEDDLDFKRVLFAYFPTYRDSPLKPKWSRVLAVGDASGIQSPLSFGGFGALTRHLERITDALSDALADDLLHKEDLGKINAYTPNLSAAWMVSSSAFLESLLLLCHSSVESFVLVPKGYVSQCRSECKFKVCESAIGCKFRDYG